jgi:hypothetical protein
MLELLFAAPWVLAIAWLVKRHGFRILVPEDDVPMSYGERASRRAAVR